MRPASIITFERFYLASFILGFAEQFMFKDELAAIAGEEGASLAASVPFLIVGAAISLLIWYLIAHRASNIAKWVLVVLTALSLLFTALGLVVTAKLSLALTAVDLVVTALALYAIVQLFKPDAKAWLEGKSG